MLIVRFRYRQVGGHFHVRVFTGSMFDGTFAKSGDLVFDIDQWRVFASSIERFRDDATVLQLKHEDEL